MEQRTTEGKIVMLGSQNVGKTCIVVRYIKGTFETTTMTIGAAFVTKRVTVGDRQVKMQIWDTAGEERFRSIAPMYYRDADAIVLAFDMTNRQSFDDLQRWVNEISATVNIEYSLHIVATKADLADVRTVSAEEAEAFATRHAATYCEVSAKEGKGTQELFNVICRSLIQRSKAKEEQPKVELTPTNETTQANDGCC